MARNQIVRGKNITQPIETNLLCLEAQGLVQDVLYLEILCFLGQSLLPFSPRFKAVSEHMMIAVKDT